MKTLLRSKHRWGMAETTEEGMRWCCSRCLMERLRSGEKWFYKSPTLGGWKLHNHRLDTVPACKTR